MAEKKAGGKLDGKMPGENAQEKDPGKSGVHSQSLGSLLDEVFQSALDRMQQGTGLKIQATLVLKIDRSGGDFALTMISNDSDLGEALGAALEIADAAVGQAPSTWH